MSARDRRDPARQRPLVGGQRSTDFRLTTRHCADTLGTSTNFILGEIRDGRLEALVLERPGKKTIYRVSAQGLYAYIRKFLWSHVRDLPK